MIFCCMQKGGYNFILQSGAVYLKRFGGLDSGRICIYMSHKETQWKTNSNLKIRHVCMKSRSQSQNDGNFDKLSPTCDLSYSPLQYFFSLEIQARSQGSSFVSSATIKEIGITNFSFPFCIMLTITGQFGNAMFASTWKVCTNRCILTF